MVRNASTRPTPPGRAEVRGRPLRVLLVDAQARTVELFDHCRPGGRDVELTRAATIEEARTRLSETRADLVAIEAALPDGNGLDLADELNQHRHVGRVIILAEQPRLDDAIRALRAGACDYLVKPIDPAEFSERVRQALTRHRGSRDQERRIKRLRRLCRKLDEARREVTDQVDVLCHDIVTAYQELATQMQQVVQTSEFGVLIRDELDLEHLLRKTLEYLVEKTGPTNAAIFLPSSMDEYSLGGYVNYDCVADSIDMLMDHLGDVLAPKVAEQDHVIHLRDPQSLANWIGDDAAYLTDSHLIAFPCRHQDDALAVVVFFRDLGQPFSEVTVDTVTALAPMLGEALARVIRVHHRAGLEFEDGDEDEALPF